MTELIKLLAVNWLKATCIGRIHDSCKGAVVIPKAFLGTPKQRGEHAWMLQEWHKSRISQLVFISFQASLLKLFSKVNTTLL